MNSDRESLSLDSDFLSNTELYYSPADNVNGDELTIYGEEYGHIVRVMRHSAGDALNVTDGKGSIYACEIADIRKDHLIARVRNRITYENKLKNICFCIARLKSADRFEFALEKCVELGITNFIVFEAIRSVSKGEKLERWQKVLVSSMKQSLRSYLPEIKFYKNLSDIKKLEGEKIIFEQHSDKRFSGFAPAEGRMHYLVFGPEGGLDKNEIDLFDAGSVYCLTENRLRSETAVITASAIIAML